MCDTLRHIHHRHHLLRLIVPVSPTFPQPTDLMHHQTVRPGTHILKVREPLLVDKPLDVLPLQQHVEEILKPLPTQSARRRRQSQKPSLRPSLPQRPISFRQRMMRLVNDNQRRIDRNLLDISINSLYTLYINIMFLCYSVFIMFLCYSVFI